MASARKSLLYRLRLKFKFWLAFQVLVPTLSVALIWPAHVLFNRPFGFERTFSGADLLLLGALLLFGAMIDIYYEQRASNLLDDDVLDTLYIVNGAAGLLLMIIYGFLRIYMVLYDFPQTATVSPPDEVKGCAYASLIGLIAAAAWSGFTIHRSYDELLKGSVSRRVS